MLTIAQAKAAAPRARGYKLAAGHGLHLFVAPTGRKSWRMKYRFERREKLLTIGRFPETAMAAAHARCLAAKEKLAAGIDPGAAVAGADLESVAREWHALQLPRWSPAHAGDVIASLERDVFPALGAKPVAEIGATALLNVIRSVERRDRVQAARRLRQRLSAIFRYAISQEITQADPAAMLDQAMRAAPLARPMPALTTIEEARALLAACERTPAMRQAILASRFLALTAVRLAAVRGATWGEIEDLHGPAPVWRIPAARMKLSRAKKAEPRFDHIVPLSPQAAEVLKRAAQGFGHRLSSPDMFRIPGGWLIFPGLALDRPIGERAIGDLYARAGFAGRHVPHGWRASFSTILNEDLGETWSEAIDRALAHATKGKVEAAYNRSEQLDRRRAVFERWGELLAA